MLRDDDVFITVVGPRLLPAAGLVPIWIDAGSGPGVERQVPTDWLTLAPSDDGLGTHAFYLLRPRPQATPNRTNREEKAHG